MIPRASSETSRSPIMPSSSAIVSSTALRAPAPQQHLRLPQRFGRLSPPVAPPFDRASVQRVSRDHLIDDAAFLRLLRGESLAQHQQLGRASCIPACAAAE